MLSVHLQRVPALETCPAEHLAGAPRPGCKEDLHLALPKTASSDILLSSHNCQLPRAQRTSSVREHGTSVAAPQRDAATTQPRPACSTWGLVGLTRTLKHRQQGAKATHCLCPTHRLAAVLEDPALRTLKTTDMCNLYICTDTHIYIHTHTYLPYVACFRLHAYK